MGSPAESGEAQGSQWDERAAESARVVRQRRREAMKDGMSLAEAQLFSESEIDVGELRHLVALACPADLLARILL